MRALCIWTPFAKARRSADGLRLLHGRLEHEVATADRPGAAAELAASAAGCDLVIAAGGDGCLHEVANGLMRRPGGPLPLGILPIGTGNDVARNLGLRSPEEAVAAIEAGGRRPIDLIRIRLRVGGRTDTVYGVLNAGIGYSAEVIHATTPTVKRICGPKWAYSAGTLLALMRWRSPTFRVRWDGGETTARMLWLGVGNGEYEGGGTLRVSPGARLDDGQLDCLIAHHGPKHELVRNFTRIMTGGHVHHRLCRYFPVRWLEVTASGGRCNGQVEVQCDGDVIGRTPLRLEVLPSALEVFAP